MIYAIFFIILFLSELIYFRIARYFNIIDKPNLRSSHTRITIRGGGIVFYFGVLIYSLWFGNTYPWFITGLSFIAFISLVDDIRPVSGRTRLLVHFTTMLFLFVEWGLFSGLPWWYMILALVFCTGIINAYNFMDGINGLTGGYTIAILLTMIWINAKIVLFIDPSLLYLSLLSVLVFCFFNFRKQAHCFAGDVGSVSMAFILLFLLGRLMLLSGDLRYIVLLAVYGVDSVLTIVHRLMLSENIFEAHRKHAYQLLANELKIPHVQVTILYIVIQVFIDVVYLIVFSDFKWYCFFGIFFILTLGYVLFMHRFFYLHTQKV